VVVINADKLRVTGDKLADKLYYRHSGRPGSLRVESLEERMTKYPERAIRDAVWGMLPKGRLGRKLLRKLKVYRGSDHPHEAQQPKIHSW
jgi:large subunit ribosomal protein L13